MGAGEPRRGRRDVAVEPHLERETRLELATPTLATGGSRSEFGVVREASRPLLDVELVVGRGYESCSPSWFHKGAARLGNAATAHVVTLDTGFCLSWTPSSGCAFTADATQERVEALGRGAGGPSERS